MQERGQEIASRALDSSSRDAVLAAVGVTGDRLLTLRRQAKDKQQELLVRKMTLGSLQIVCAVNQGYFGPGRVKLTYDFLHMSVGR